MIGENKRNVMEQAIQKASVKTGVPERAIEKIVIAFLTSLAPTIVEGNASIAINDLGICLVPIPPKYRKNRRPVPSDVKFIRDDE